MRLPNSFPSSSSEAWVTTAREGRRPGSGPFHRSPATTASESPESTDHPTAVLVLSSGSPRTYGEIEDYLRVNAQTVSPKGLATLTSQYHRVGGPSTAHDMGWLQKISLQRELDARRPHELRVYSAYLNWHPFISEVAQEIVSPGASRVIAMPLAPQFDPASSQELIQQLEAARSVASGVFEVKLVDAFAKGSGYEGLLASRLSPLVARDSIVYFTTPAPRDGGDPGLILDRLRQFVSPVVSTLELRRWDVAFERSEAGWPNDALLSKLGDSPDDATAVVVSIGTTTDSYSTDFGIDIECSEVLRSRGITMRRVDALNHDDAFIGFLADAVESVLER